MRRVAGPFNAQNVITLEMLQSGNTVRLLLCFSQGRRIFTLIKTDEADGRS